jgi:membrane-bound metal-dependent hydrolase YbcI (DUF457 family)
MTSTKTDVFVVILLAIAISGYEFYSAWQLGDTAVASSARFVSHTLAFVISFPITIALIRKSGAAKDFKSALAGGVLTTSIMSILIVLFDYMPFLR